MRADRLLSLLMLLQTRGRMTAQALADELEVSVRTVYRDIEALSGAGVPIYADRGPGGGCAFVDNYRTELTGLHEGEVRALFIANMPGALADLGLGADLKAALLKLLAALPAERRGEDRWVRQRIFLDWENWQKGATAIIDPCGACGTAPRHRPCSLSSRQCGTTGCCGLLTAAFQAFTAASSNAWWPPTAWSPRKENGISSAPAVQKVATGSESLGWQNWSMYAALLGPSRRPAEFDLEDTWRAWCDHIRQDRGRYVVTTHVSPQMYADLPLYLGEHIVEGQDGPWGEDAQNAAAETAWRPVTLSFDSLEEARTKLLGLGAGVEVMTPVALRRSLLDYAQQVVIRYSRH